jgi:hypothetical protein
MKDDKLAYFHETFEMLNSQSRKYNYRIKHYKEDYNQKKLLNAFALYKKNKKKQVLELIKKTPFNNLFLEATRKYLIGMTHNHFGEYSFAIEHLERSVELYQEINEENYITLPIILLILTYGNRKDIPQMKKYVDLMNKYQNSTFNNEYSFNHAMTLYLVLSNQFEKAKKLIHLTLNSKSPNDRRSVDLYKPAFQVLEFCVSFKEKSYESCYIILDQYKKTKGFTIKANYSYMKVMLDHLTKDSTLYVYKQDYKDFPELYYQLEVIKNLAIGDVKEATQYWNKLAHHNEALYQSDFIFTGDYSLFSAGLEKHIQNSQIVIFDQSIIDSLTTPMHKLDYIFKNSFKPIEKDLIVKLIWKEEVTEVNMARLRKLVYDYKKKHSLDVKSIQNTYFLKVS